MKPYELKVILIARWWKVSSKSADCTRRKNNTKFLAKDSPTPASQLSVCHVCSWIVTFRYFSIFVGNLLNLITTKALLLPIHYLAMTTFAHTMDKHIDTRNHAKQNFSLKKCFNMLYILPV